MPIMNWKELVAANQERMGNYPAPEEQEPEWLKGWDPSSPNADEDRYQRYKTYLLGEDSPEGRRKLEQHLQSVDYTNKAYTNEDVINSGYGEEKIDYQVPFSQWRENPVDARANAQSWGEKFANGAIKFGSTAASTSLDNTVGLIFGIGNMIYNGIVEEESKALNSFIQNPFSNLMQSWREGSEERHPNYRTVEELEDADRWWKHLNANFWGDVFLKNLGFTVGAGASMAVVGSGLGKMAAKITDKAYKAGIAAAAGDKNAANVIQRIAQGEALANPGKIYNALGLTERAYYATNWASQWLGGLFGALGEGRVEALNNAKEYRDDMLPKAAEKYENDKDELMRSMLSDRNMVMFLPGYAEPVLTKEGNDYYNIQLKKIQDKYKETIKFIDEQAERVANTTFSWNIPVLTASNVFMLGKIASGGFRTQARGNVRFKNGKYEGVGSVGRGIAKGLGNAAVEGNEELIQKIISEYRKEVGSENYASFNNSKYDKNGTRAVSEWLMDMLDSAGNVLFDPKSWEEFAVGFLTGAIGMPSRHGWAGGIVGGYKDVMDQLGSNQKIAERLNSIVTNPEFLDQLKDMIRHKKLEDVKDVALAKDDRFIWHTADDEQLISDVMAFDDAGKLSDLEGFVDSLLRVDEKNVANIKGKLIDDSDRYFERKSDKELVDWLHERARDIKGKIRKFRNYSNAINFASFNTMNPDAIKELVYTRTQLDNFEERYGKLYPKVMKDIRPYLQDVARRTVGGQPTDSAKIAQRLLASESDMAHLFGTVSSESGFENDADIEGFETVKVDDTRQKQVLKTLEDLGLFADKPDTRKDIEDLQKLVKHRQEFYRRLFDPRSIESFAERFEQEAKTDESAAQDLNNDDVKSYVDNTIQNLRGSSNIREFIAKMKSINAPSTAHADALDDAIRNDDELTKFTEVLDDTYQFVNSVSDVISGRMVTNTDPALAPVYDEIEDLLNGVNIDDSLSDLADNEDATVHVAKKLLSKLSVSPEAEGIIRSVFDEVLGNIAQSNDLGVMPVPPTGGNPGGGQPGGNPGTGGGAGGGTSTFEHLAELIDNITDKDNPTLKKLAEGDFTGYDDLTDQQKSELFSLASARLDKIRRDSGEISDDDSSDYIYNPDEEDIDSPSRVRARKERQYLELNSLSGSHIQYYAPGTTENNLDPRTWGLRQGVKRFTQGNTVGMQSTLKWFQSHKVQTFVDSGALMELEKAYQKNGKHLPIYFVGNPHFEQNNLNNNPFVVENTNKSSKYGRLAPEVLLAVEMSDDNRKILSKYEGFAFDNDSLITIEGKQYQVIGEVWNPTPKEIQDKPVDKQNDYKEIKNNANMVWEHTMFGSVIPQYNADINKPGPEGKWYVAKNHPTVGPMDASEPDLSSGDRIYTTLNYVMSGRNETRSVSEPDYKKIELRNSLSKYRELGKPYYFALPTKKEGIKKTIGCKESLPADIVAPLGSLWMATQTANGNYSWSYITIARSGEYDFDANSGTALIQNLNKAVNNLFSTDPSVTLDQRISACKVIKDIFYIGEGNALTIGYTPSGFEVNLAGFACKTKEEFMDALKAGNFRFQVDADRVENGISQMNELIDAGVLKSEMRTFIRMGATFGVNLMSDKNDNGEKVPNLLYALEPGTERTIAYTAGQTPVSADFNTDNSVNNVRIANVGYKLQGNNVYYMSANGRAGEEVHGRDVRAQVIALSEVLERMKKGDNKRVDLSSYPGEVWVIERAFPKNKKDIVKDFQYVELYEREIDGVKVHMSRWGKNGAVQLVWDNQLWDSLMELAKESNINSNKFVQEKPVSQQEEDDDILSRFDAARAADEGGTPGVAPSNKRRVIPRRHSSTGNSTATTPQSQSINDDKQQDQIDCG